MQNGWEQILWCTQTCNPWNCPILTLTTGNYGHGFLITKKLYGSYQQYKWIVMLDADLVATTNALNIFDFLKNESRIYAWHFSNGPITDVYRKHVEEYVKPLKLSWGQTTHFNSGDVVFLVLLCKPKLANVPVLFVSLSCINRFQWSHHIMITSSILFETYILEGRKLEFEWDHDPRCIHCHMQHHEILRMGDTRTLACFHAWSFSIACFTRCLMICKFSSYLVWLLFGICLLAIEKWACICVNMV